MNAGTSFLKPGTGSFTDSKNVGLTAPGIYHYTLVTMAVAMPRGLAYHRLTVQSPNLKTDVPVSLRICRH
jgi:hypothetical protein